MNTHQPFYIFSVESPEQTPAENKARTEYVSAWLKREGTRFIIVTGRYQCRGERSFLVFEPSGERMMLCRRHVLQIARLYDQDTVLYVDANRRACLYSSEGGRLVELGEWRQYEPASAEASITYTRTLDGRYWIAA